MTRADRYARAVPMPFRCAPDRLTLAWIAAAEALFWLPTRLLAGVRERLGAARGDTASRIETSVVANDNRLVVAAANSNVPRRLA
ncbi:MAG: hypothetical protein AB7P02_02950 [Alphaproteobacteria bacterium]